MRRLLIVLLICCLLGCGEEFSCHTGEMRCSGNEAQMCNADRQWVDWLSCSGAGKTCYTDRSHCGGYGDIACCD